MKFSVALEALDKGKRVACEGWNGKGMWLYRIHPYAPHPDTIGGRCGGYTNPYFKAADNNEHAKGTMLSWIGIKTATNGFVPWTPSQEDMSRDDWVILD
jgi:hypothetical protein